MGFNSGSGGGNGQISQAGDVALNTVANKQVLTYDSTINKWKNATPQAAGSSSDIEFSPYDYGFVDGMNNATASVQATITAAMQNGGVVKLPLGNINVTTLNLDYANMTAQSDNGAPYGYPGPIILGQGMRNTRIVQNRFCVSVVYRRPVDRPREYEKDEVKILQLNASESICRG